MNTLGFIGGGNMATAMGKAIISNDVCKPSDMWVSGPRIENLAHWKAMGVNVTTKNADVVDKCCIIILAVKPHILEVAVKEALSASHKGDKLFISVLAGTTLLKLKENLSKFPNNRIIRVMPNTPAMLGVGASVYCADPLTTHKEDLRDVERILACTGLYQDVPENMINAYGALAGSGPAYIYLIIEALADGGVKQGIPREAALKFAAQTVLGAAKMVLYTGKHPGQLKDEVCSPGGTTICGMHELEKGGVRAAMMNAIEAAVQRTLTIEKK